MRGEERRENWVAGAAGLAPGPPGESEMLAWPLRIELITWINYPFPSARDALELKCRLVAISNLFTLFLVSR